MSVFDDILIGSEIKDGKVEQKYFSIAKLRDLNKSNDIFSFLKQFELDCIEGFTFDKILGDGQASLTALYLDQNGNKCLIKFLISPRNDSEYQNFVNEFAALKTLTHHKIKYKASPKSLIDFQKQENYPIYYFGMEFIEGKTLYDYMKENTLPLDWKSASNIIFRISLALYEVNVNRIIHRDLHPGNIMLIESDDVKDININSIDPLVRILDFGNKVNSFGILFGDEFIGDMFRLEGAITSWSPEYVVSKEKGNDTAQDIWALGILYYKLLTNKLPLEVDNLSELVKVYSSKRNNIDWSLLDDLPDPIIHFVKRMLDFDPKKRIFIGPLTYVLHEVLNNDLLDSTPAYLKEFLEKDGQLGDPLDYIY